MKFALAVLLFITAYAHASVEPMPHPEPLNYLEDISPLIYNGTRSQPGEFPPVGWIGNCTGTLVGPQVLFTAAHCVSNGKRISFSHRGSGQSYAATCTRHPRVNTRNWYNDYAFCKLDRAVPEDTVLASFKAYSPAIGEKLLLNGLGAPNVRTHYWGEATVRRNSNQDIVTCGPANLGGGDSGGSLLEWTEDRTGKSGFQVLGVNSRGGGGCSYFNRVNGAQFLDWASSYAQNQNVTLCGINGECDPTPTPPEACEAEFVALSDAFDELASFRCPKKAITVSHKANELALCLEDEQF